jgi:hypothetical protein
MELKPKADATDPISNLHKRSYHKVKGSDKGNIKSNVEKYKFKSKSIRLTCIPNLN